MINFFLHKMLLSLNVILVMDRKMMSMRRGISVQNVWNKFAGPNWCSKASIILAWIQFTDFYKSWFTNEKVYQILSVFTVFVNIHKWDSKILSHAAHMLIKPMKLHSMIAHSFFSQATRIFAAWTTKKICIIYYSAKICEQSVSVSTLVRI